MGQPFVGDNVGRRRVGVVWDHVWAPVALGRYVDDAPSRCTNSGGSVRTHHRDDFGLINRVVGLVVVGELVRFTELRRANCGQWN